MTELSRAVWRKSTRSGNNNGACVEVAVTPDVVGVRDSKDRSGPVLVFSPESWRAFVEAAKKGELDL